MSWLKSTVVVVVTLMLMAFASSAFAEHVDWSDYIDHSPSKPLASQPSTQSTSQAPAKVSKKRVAKRATPKKKVKQARVTKRGHK
jgi:hypothetical protein